MMAKKMAIYREKLLVLRKLARYSGPLSLFLALAGLEGERRSHDGYNE